MKSAYELAMERLDASDPDNAKPLTKQQRAKLAEIDAIYEGKIAERDIFLKQKLKEAMADRNLTEIDLLRPEIASERARLETEREEEKERVRQG
jgi:hypothetical protein